MKDVLEDIVAHKRIEVAQQKEILSTKEIQKRAEDVVEGNVFPKRSMSDSLAHSSSGIIAEFKRKSPSKGWIKEDGKPEIIPLRYQENGASAVSILTDQQFFGGHNDFLSTARNLIDIPILRKDFIVDEYQVMEAKTLGADAILLIAAAININECKKLAALAKEFNLETLLEIHSEKELDYVGDNIDMVGVNNRNLGTFHTDVNNSFKLAEKLPNEFVLVSESGISSPSTILQLRQIGFKGFLIGETFMKTENPGQMLKEFVKKIEQN